METNENEKLESRLQAFHDGTEQRAWEWLGAHRAVKDGKKGVQFCVWAPHAADVSVIHEKSGWARDLAPMTRMAEDSEFWSCFLTDIERYDCYKYSIRTKGGQVLINLIRLLSMQKCGRQMHRAIIRWTGMYGAMMTGCSAERLHLNR